MLGSNQTPLGSKGSPYEKYNQDVPAYWNAQQGEISLMTCAAGPIAVDLKAQGSADPPYLN
jgi:hypothetical protein